jgi:glycine cleavage system H protein
MEGFKYVDIFATKGIEYLAVVAFLITLIVFWRFLNRTESPVKSVIPDKIKTTLIDWFYLADNFFYHQGHSWAMPENQELVRVGMDDFAQKLLGKPSDIKLPKVGSKVVQGEKGWELEFNGQTIDALSPVNGKVVEVNEEILREPDLLNKDPYQKGWLLKVRPSNLRTDEKNLLSGVLAKAWIEDTVNRLSTRITGNFGVVLQDGGLPIAGFAKEIAPADWDKLAREFLLTSEMN